MVAGTIAQQNLFRKYLEREDRFSDESTYMYRERPDDGRETSAEIHTEAERDTCLRG